MYLEYITTLKEREPSKINLQFVKSQLMNSWNTEGLLRYIAENITGSSERFVIQWAFPQAYYSAFNSTLAFFKAVGHSENSHAAVRSKVADLAYSGKYPEKLCVWCDGAKENMVVGGIECSTDNFFPNVYREYDKNDIKCHINSYLKSTRKLFLKKKREDKRKDFKTKRNKIKERLSSSEWDEVSKSLKKTSWLCLLYRKRIKANYQDIDTFLSPELEVFEILRGVIKMVNVLNFTNELSIYKYAGNLMLDWNDDRYEFVSERLERVSQLYNILA